MKTKFVALMVFLFLKFILANDSILRGKYSTQYEEVSGDQCNWVVVFNESTYESNSDLGGEAFNNCNGRWRLNSSSDTLVMHSRNCVNLWNPDESEHVYVKMEDILYPIKNITSEGFEIRFQDEPWIRFKKDNEE